MLHGTTYDRRLGVRSENQAVIGGTTKVKWFTRGAVKTVSQRCSVVVVLALLFVVTHGRRMAPFEDENCSWQTTTRTGTQFTNASDGCKNQDRLNLTVEEISKNFQLEQYTCLSVSTVIDPCPAATMMTIRLSLRGKEVPDLNAYLRSDLEYNSSETHAITNECFCGLRPQRRYQVVVTTKPVDGDHTTTERKSHTTNGCSEADKINDTRCYKSEEALWEPDCILVEQNHTTGFYNLIDVSFNVAPSHYKFDIYKIYITSSSKESQLGSFQVYMSEATVVNKTCSQSNKSMPFVTVSADIKDWKISPTSGNQFQAVVVALPTGDVCLDEQNRKIRCKTSSPKTFCVLSDPCIRKPCGAHGSCTSNMEEYICNCDPGFTVFDKACKVDPCSGDRNVSRPKCQNGNCIYIGPGNDFYCQCNANFVAHAEGKKCLADPCAVIPETNATFCGVYGKCQINTTMDPADRSCQCDPGYISKKSETPCTVKEAENLQSMLIWAAVGTFLCGSFLVSICIFIHLCRRRRRNYVPDNVRENDDPLEGYNGLDYIVARRRVLPIYSADDHPQHLEVVVRFCRFLQKHCQCDVSLMEWEKSIGPTVEMWLTNQIEEADVVLLICSKGTGLKYRAKAQQKQMDAAGVYGDVFIKALFLLEHYFGRDNACDKFVVTYFDYTCEGDIPVPFRRFAKYKLMKSMEALYLRIHCKGRESPNSSTRAQPLDEPNYPELEMGRWLYDAIEAMKRLVKSDKEWYKKPDSKRNTNWKASFASDNEQPFTDPHRSDADSAYRTGDHDEPRALGSFFISNDSHSIGQSSEYSDFDESFNQIRSRVPEPPRDDVFPDDIDGLTDPEEGYSDNLNSMEVPLNEIQIGFPQRPYCNVTAESPL